LANPNTLWGVWLGERLTAVFIDKGYDHLWRCAEYSESDRDSEQVKLGINIIIFALA